MCTKSLLLYLPQVCSVGIIVFKQGNHQVRRSSPLILSTPANHQLTKLSPSSNYHLQLINSLKIKLCVSVRVHACMCVSLQRYIRPPL